ncbi:MerR family transcriptional regulator [Lachnoclostridium sp.]|uniref:MerR family transcriptional regulator n=1 Tax=Lachnoclostridium sp. TaxID=2028282 RepID=UPI002899AB13|nr:MerR family transcriptional regulator [Lachnoclostridium sp.]
MKEIEMKMSEICDLIGISPQGVRLYEKYNAIESFKWHGNGYRYYYFENLGPAIGLRSYRNLDIPIKEAAKLCNGTIPGKIKETLLKREKEILYEIKMKEAHLKCIKDMSLLIDDVLNKYNKFSCCERPAMYYLKCEENNEILKGKEDRKLIRSWSDKFPFVKFCPIIEYKNLTNNVIAKVGLCVKEEFAEFVPRLDNLRVKYYNTRKCIGGVVRVTQDTEDYYSVVEPGLNYLKENNLELDGDILSILIAPTILTSEPEEIIADYHYIWMPFK